MARRSSIGGGPRARADDGGGRDALSIGDLIFLGNTPAADGGGAAAVVARDEDEELLMGDGFNSFGLARCAPGARDLDNCLFRLCESINYRRLGNGGGGAADAPAGFVSPRSAEAAGGEAADGGGGGGGGEAHSGGGSADGGGGAGHHHRHAEKDGTTPHGGGGGHGHGHAAATSGAGLPLTFGLVVQLQHVKSGKFLTAQSTQVADDDPECMRCELDAGSGASHFEVAPVWRIQGDGSAVFSSNRVRLLSLALGDHFLHAAANANAASGGGGVEVNLSPVSGGADTAWQLQLFRKHSTDSGGGGGGGGGGSSGEGAGGTTGGGGPGVGAVANGAVANGAAPALILLGEYLSFFHSEGQAYLRAHSASSKRHHCMRARADGGGQSLKTCFQFEDAARPRQGGCVCWGTPYRIRQVSSGMYLAVGRGAGAAAAAAAGMVTLARSGLGDGTPLAVVALVERAEEADLWAVTPTLVAADARRADRHAGSPVSWAVIRQCGCHLRCVPRRRKDNVGPGGGGANLTDMDSAEQLAVEEAKGGGAGGGGVGGVGGGGGYWIHLPAAQEETNSTKARAVFLAPKVGDDLLPLSFSCFYFLSHDCSLTPCSFPLLSLLYLLWRAPSASRQTQQGLHEGRHLHLPRGAAAAAAQPALRAELLAQLRGVCARCVRQPRGGVGEHGQ